EPRGPRRLLAYVVAARTPGPETGELRRFLADRLPDYLVPSEIMALPALPLTPNGKVDRRALPAPGEPAASAPEFALPRTPLERQVAALWCDLLGLSRVGIHDNFLRVGGNSLLAIRLCNGLRRSLGIELPLRTLLRAGTVARLAEAIAASLGEAGEAMDEPLPAIAPSPAGASEPFPPARLPQAHRGARGPRHQPRDTAP